MMRSSTAQLYGITTPLLCRDSRTLRAGAQAALRAGLRWLQYRHKHASTDTARRQALLLTNLCKDHGATLLINDRLPLAEDLGVGVHLGRGDTPVATARRRLGPAALIGATCHGDVDYALACLADGASYASIGRLYASTTKPTAPSTPLQCLRELRARTDGSLCATGGIGERELAAVSGAGADLVAVGAALFDTDDVAAAATRMLAALSTANSQYPT